MKKYLFALLAMLVLILCSKTAIAGGQEGIEICLRTVIPSLFPFILVAQYLCGNLSGQNIKILHPLEKLCQVPDGSGGLLITGFLGGYPVGASSVYSAWKSGQLTEAQGQRMLGFLNNAGPAFIFGMGTALFSNPLIPWVVWGSHILCAVFTAMLLPGEKRPSQIENKPGEVTLVHCLKNTIQVLAQVCGWVILFRMMLAFLFSIPGGVTPEIKATVAGTLELTNGCLLLQTIPEEWVRYLLLTLFLNMGGLCVAMQTISVVGELGIGMYWRGKVMQSLLGSLLSVLLLPILFPHTHAFTPAAYMTVIAGFGFAGLLWKKYLKNSWHFAKIGV